MKFMPYLVIFAAIAAVGCSTSRGKFTRQNYEALYYTQPAAEVLEIMGKPSTQESDRWVYEHAKPFYRAEVLFKDGKVIGRLWWDDPFSGPTSAPAPRRDFGPKSDAKNKHHKNPTSRPAKQRSPGLSN
jgi:hypothetical protein